VFEVVARPNGWQKQVKQENKSGSGSASSLNEARQTLFMEVLEDVVAVRPAIRLPKRGTLSWLSFSSGPWGSGALATTKDGQVRVEASIDSGNAEVNRALFEELHAGAAEVQRQVGQLVAWEALDGRRACRTAVYFPLTDPSDPVEAAALRPALAGTAIAMHHALNEQLRRRARELKQAMPS
jgi:hypothetical protein